MPSRQAKKLHQQQELLRIQNLAAAEEDEGSSEDEVAPQKPKANAFAGFAALGGDDDGDSDNNDNADHDEEEAEPEPEPSAPAPTSAKKSSKSKKKKKKAKKSAAATADEGEHKPEAGGLDEIDQALRELSMQPPPRTTTGQTDKNAASVPCDKLARLLCISFDHLKVVNELRAMFGQETLDSVRRQEEAQRRDDERRRHHRGATMQVDMETFLKGKPGQKIPDVVLRRNPFIHGKDHWPKATAGGLKMVAVTDERVDPTEYAFSHDKGYELLEMQFFSLVDMMDPMSIVHFLGQNPYHVNALIQTSKVAKQDSNAALAGELCERALFTFGRVTLSSFRKKLQQGQARLDFRRPENRQFWLAGYHYIKSLMQRGAYDTALEWAKLFLSASPKDEYAMLNFIHVLSIYAYEAKWLIALCNSDYFDQYSEHLGMQDYYRQTRVLAKLQVGDKEGAMTDLIQGMETLPGLYSALCSAINIDTPRAVWGVEPQSEEDELFTQLYIHMAKDLWKRDGIALLKEAGERARKADPSSLVPAKASIPLSIGRFIYLDNTPDLMGLVPSNMLHASPNFDYDPLPPPLEDNIFSNEWQSIPWRRAESSMDDIRRGQMDELLAVARGLMAQQRGEGAAREAGDPGADADEANAQELAAAAAAGGEGGFLSTLARMLLPVWMTGGGGADGEDGPDEADIRAALGQNPWDENTDTEEDEIDDDELPDLIQDPDEARARGATAPGHGGEGGDEDIDDEPRR